MVSNTGLVSDSRSMDLRRQTVVAARPHNKGSVLYRASVTALKNVSGRLSKILQRLEEPATPTPEPIVHLLIVDDEEAIRFSMSEYFTHHGFNVDTAQELEEAEELLGKNTYEVVIQDLRIGPRHREGLEIIKLIRERNPETRIVVLTAYGSSEVEDEVRRSGADAILRKPKPLSQVAQVIQGLVESRRPQQA